MFVNCVTFVKNNNRLKKSALSENEGIPQPNFVGEAAVQKIQFLRRQIPTVEEITAGIFAGNKTFLSRGITLIESTNELHFQNGKKLIEACLPKANQSVRIGITGVPGVGKSTFIEAFGLHLIAQGKKVAVLAVDPSSTVSHGSILGDKTRMEQLVKEELSYIRPSASGETLGGVARKTREAIILCEAAGFDVILIETVGVGQSETAVHSMVDFFLLLGLSGAGDGLQGIKRGIMEMADLVVITKADGDNKNKANLAKTEMNRAMHFFAEKKSNWRPFATTCSATENLGIAEIWDEILAYEHQTKTNNYFFENRKLQNEFWFFETINQRLQSMFYGNQANQNKIQQLKEAISNQEISPFEAAEKLFE
jgi:LAO/AO transport system kinase